MKIPEGLTKKIKESIVVGVVVDGSISMLRRKPITEVAADSAVGAAANVAGTVANEVAERLTESKMTRRLTRATVSAATRYTIRALRSRGTKEEAVDER